MASRKPILLLVLHSVPTHFQISPGFQYYPPPTISPPGTDTHISLFSPASPSLSTDLPLSSTLATLITAH